MKSLALFPLFLPIAQAETALTIYNQDLAVIRESLPLDLPQGSSSFTFDRATAQVLPDSVVLRDPAGKAEFSILEQSYRNDPVSQGLLLDHFEGQTIEFETKHLDGKTELIPGKIIRSGYGRNKEPIIEINGKLQFTLPGQPLFPALGDDSILRPTLGWQIHAPTPAKFAAQLSYLSRGFQWEADYNLVAPEKGETASLTGWITLINRSGTDFQEAKVKLVAGNVNIIQENRGDPFASRMTGMKSARMAESTVQEKAFDDFHLYTLPRPLRMRDQETKQVEFIRSLNVKSHKVYYYDPVLSRYRGNRHRNPTPHQTFSKDVKIFWKIKNDEASGLGMPLPKGRMRFYRSDDADGNLEFVGENNINHTPRNETIQVYTGNAFDLVGERKITNFLSNERQNWMRETIEITLKNRSKEAKTIIAREHLWRWSNWEIEKPSLPFQKTDAQTIEFTAALKPDETKVITFTAHYHW